MSEENNVTTDSSALKALQGLQKGLSSELKEGLSKLSEPNQEQPQVEEQTNQNPNLVESGGGEQVPDASTTETAVDKTEAPVATDESGEEVVTNPMFGNKNLAVQEVQAEEQQGGVTEINSFEDFDKLINSYGIKDANELGSKLKSITETEEKYADLSKQWEGVDNVLRSLPPELYQAVERAARNEDWREPLNSAPQIDLRKDVEDYDAKTLIETFMPDEQFTEDDWEEYNDEHGDPATKRAIKMALKMSKERYTNKQNEIRTSSERRQQEEAERVESFTKSISKSAQNLKSSIEGLDDNYVKGLEKQIQEGGVYNAFYNQDGTIKEDALLRLMRTTDDYESYVQIRINNAAKEARNKAIQEMLDRGNHVPNMRSGSNNNSGSNIRPEVQAELDKIMKLKETKRF